MSKKRMLASGGSVRACVLLALVAACGQSDSNGSIGSSSAAVSGGGEEAGYPATVYLIPASDPLPGCTGVLIAPDIVATAAHCVPPDPSVPWLAGFGAVAANNRIAIRRWLADPSHMENGEPEYRHDVALALLASPSTVTPATIGAPAVGDRARYVGYGETGIGTATGDRKSTSAQVEFIDNLNVWIKDFDGATCKGDSGGPLYKDGTNTVFGVLTEPWGDYSCQPGTRSIFSWLAAESDFIACATTFLHSDGTSAALPQRGQNSNAASSDAWTCNWATPFVQGLEARNVITGTPDPTHLLTRGEVAELMVSAFQPAPARDAQTFSDLAPNDPHAQALMGAYRANFLDATADGKINPGGTITRRELLLGISKGLNLQIFAGGPSFDLIDREAFQPDDQGALISAMMHNMLVNYPHRAMFHPYRPAKIVDAASMIYQGMVYAGKAAKVNSPYILQSAFAQ